MTAEGAGWNGEPRTATAEWSRESGADGHSGDAMTGRGDTRKASSAAANKAGARGRHGARLELRGMFEGRWDNPASKFSVLWGDDRVCEASGVANDFSGVGDKEGGHEASGVTENPREYHQGVEGGVESPQDTNTPGVAEFPWGDENPK